MRARPSRSLAVMTVEKSLTVRSAFFGSRVRIPERFAFLPPVPHERRPARVSSSTRRSASSSRSRIASDFPDDGAPTSIAQHGSSSVSAFDTPTTSTACRNASSPGWTSR
jgi:hypothetical protein